MYRLRSGGIIKERSLKSYGTGIVALLLALVGGGAFAAEAGADPGRSALTGVLVSPAHVPSGCRRVLAA